MRRRRVKPPIQVYGPPALLPVTVELSESWVISYTGNVQEQRMGPSYKWTPRLTHSRRQELMFSFNHMIEGVKVLGVTADTISLHGSCSISKATLALVRDYIELNEMLSIAEAKPVTV